MRIRRGLAIFVALTMTALAPSAVASSGKASVYGDVVAAYFGGSYTVASDGSAVQTDISFVATTGLKVGGGTPTQSAWFYAQRTSWAPDGSMIGYEFASADPSALSAMTSDPLLRETTAGGSLPYVDYNYDFAIQDWVVTSGMAPVEVTWTDSSPLVRFQEAQVWYPGDVNQITMDVGQVRNPAAASGSVFGIAIPQQNTTDSYVYLARHVNVTPKG